MALTHGMQSMRKAKPRHWLRPETFCLQQTAKTSDPSLNSTLPKLSHSTASQGTPLLRARRPGPRAPADPSAMHLGRWVSGDGAANDETRDAMSIHSLYGAGANTFRTHTPDGLPQTRRAGGQCPFGTRRSRSAIDGRPAHRRKGARATLGHRGKPICRSGTGRTVADKSPVLPEG